MLILILMEDNRVIVELESNDKVNTEELKKRKIPEDEERCISITLSGERCKNFRTKTFRCWVHHKWYHYVTDNICCGI